MQNTNLNATFIFPETLTTQPQSSSSNPSKAWFAVTSATHVGMRRRNNQDNHVVLLANDNASWEKFGHLLIVADGMGAHAAGELASQLAVEQIPHHYRKLHRGSHSAAMEQALIETNAEIYRRGQANPEFRSMGTTTCALTVVPEGAIIAHVGDSRTYRLRGSQFEQLTFDHSLVWEMRASGDISEEAIKNSTIPKNVITRSLGPNPSVMVDIEGPYPLRVGDRFLLCSDGLSGQLSDEEIGTMLMLLDIETAAQAMVDLANLRGGPDNITVIIGEVRSLEGVPSTSDTNSAIKNAPRPSYPMSFGIVSAVAALLAVVLLLLGQFPIAILALGAAIVAFASGWFKFQALAGSSTSQTKGHGKGPYRQYRCRPDAPFATNLEQVVEELQTWFAENKWPTPSEQVLTQFKRAKEASAVKNYAEAIRGYVFVILDMMKQARENQAHEEEERDTPVDDDEDGIIDY